MLLLVEDDDLNLEIGRKLAMLSESLTLPVVFKGSFDKANRSRLDSPRGSGLKIGLARLERVKRETGLPILTDIHEPEQAVTAAEVADVLQISAFLCRQTDLLVAAAKTGKPVNVKKGQHLAPWDMKYVVEKLNESGCNDLLLTDRGTQFGYNNLVADMRSIPIMQEFGHPVIFDATHSAQLPGGAGSSTAGTRELIPTLAKSAVAAGCNGLFMEVHDDVENAKSDSATQWPLDKLKYLLNEIKKIQESLS